MNQYKRQVIESPTGERTVYYTSLNGYSDNCRKLYGSEEIQVTMASGAIKPARTRVIKCHCEIYTKTITDRHKYSSESISGSSKPSECVPLIKIPGDITRPMDFWVLPCSEKYNLPQGYRELCWQNVTLSFDEKNEVLIES